MKWPPKDQNFKRAIENCSAPTKDWTNVYTLRRCTKSVNTLAEAQQLQTESSDSGESEELYTDDELTETPCTQSQQLGRGHREKRPPSNLVPYVQSTKVNNNPASTDSTCSSPEECDETEEGYTSEPNQSVSRVLSKTCGDTSGSLAELHRAISPKMQVTSTKDVQTAVDDTDNSLLVKFVAESKVRHTEVIEEMSTIKKTIKALNKTLIAKMGRESGEDSSMSLLDSTLILGSDEEEDVKFCVDLPVHTFDDFEKLEEELKESKPKRRALVSKYT